MKGFDFMTAKEIEKKTQSILQYIIDNAPDTNEEFDYYMLTLITKMAGWTKNGMREMLDG